MKHLKYYMSMIAGLLAMLTACTNDMVENGPSELWEKQGNEYTITTYVGIPSYEENQLPNGSIQTKIVMQTADTYLAAIINGETDLIARVQQPCEATKRYLSESYDHKLVLSVAELSAAINKLMSFTKNSKATSEKVNMAYLPTAINIENGELIIKDKFDNYETVSIANESYTSGNYEMCVNLYDIKLVLDSCKTDYITLNCLSMHQPYLHRVFL